MHINLQDLMNLSARAKAVIVEARESMLAPDVVKQFPIFSLSDVEAATNVPMTRIRSMLRNGKDEHGELPEGRTKHQLRDNPVGLDGRGHKKYFTAPDFYRLCKFVAPERLRPAGALGVTITVCNYKGGVAKSTSAACLAQALATLGYGKVCLIDLDPQGSLTNLYGFLQVLDVEPDQTALPVLAGTSKNLKKNVRQTYWPGIDIVPSCPALQMAEANFRRDLEIHGHNVMYRMEDALRELREEYDFIIFDTPPSLNNLTLHALLNSGGVVMPLPPSNLDLSSASMFWDLFIGYVREAGITDVNTKLFDFIRVFAPKIENTRSCRNVLTWIKDTYGAYFNDVSIPKSAAVSTAADSFGTVFDSPIDTDQKRSLSHETVRQAYIDLAADLAGEATEIWKAQLLTN